MPKLLLPLVAALAVGGAAAGGGVYLATRGETVEEVSPPAVQQTATPTPTAAPTATAEPTATATTEPTATPPPDSTAGKAPKGCTADELAYVDPDGRFAFCYPADMQLTTAETPQGLAATAQHPVTDSNRVIATFGWVQEPAYVPCIESPTIIKNQRFQEITVSGKTVTACFQDHYDRSQPDRLLNTTIDFATPAANGEPVLVLLAYAGSTRDGVPVTDTVDRILSSATID